jgi:hypothetical protein
MMQMVVYTHDTSDWFIVLNKCLGESPRHLPRSQTAVTQSSKAHHANKPKCVTNLSNQHPELVHVTVTSFIAPQLLYLMVELLRSYNWILSPLMPFSFLTYFR